MISSLWGRIDEAIISAQFGANTRLNFYELFQNLIENGVPAHKALEELNSVWSDGGKKKSAAKVVITADMIMQLDNGHSLSKAISRWAPYEEAALIAAGEETGQLVACLDDVKRLIIAKQKIRGAVRLALIYPSMLSIPLGYLLWVVSTQMVPAMAKVTNPATWTGAGYTLYLMAYAVTNFGIPALCLLGALSVLAVYSLPRWTGGARVFMDHMPGYALYRKIHGSTFLLNLAVMMKASVPEQKALETLDRFANPWMSERIQGAIYGLRQGFNLGQSLDNAGYMFPDKETIHFVRILASRDGFAESINRYSIRRLEQSITQVQRSADLARNLLIVLIGMVMALVLIGSQDIQSSFENRINQQTQSVR